MAPDGELRTRFARMRSVRMRVTIAAMTIVAIVLVVGAFSLLAVMRIALVRSLSGTAPQQAAELAALAARGVLPQPLPAADAPRLTLVQVIDRSGQIVAASGQLAGRPAMSSSRGSSRHITDITSLPGPGPWLVESTPATLANRQVTVLVMTSLAEMTRATKVLGGLLMAIVPTLVALVGFVVWTVAGRALRPVEVLRSEVADIGASGLSERVHVPRSSDEISRLAGTFNELLDRVEQSQQLQRSFVADASHELFTPIANIKTALEVAAAHPEHTDWPALLADLERQNGRTQRLSADLLLLARSESSDITNRYEPVDLVPLVHEAVTRHVADDRRLTVSSSPASAMVHGDRDHLTRVLTNLVDNAVRHARRDVSISLVTGSRWAQLAVTDDGPGIASEDRERIFERFVRLDTHRATAVGARG